ncbi:hypothetical protein [Olsenella profusa]|uniref:DUF5082 domain-containing protein n=1 Tax=Olsenella profusa F0195 TaxID=1125712 RepID=U2VA90_9ACTN|nr:hypothetical protein [Olsenella profusa]ERL09521.1 hypothetical protein HMPREF1316_1614 [Olsenella profusa F0195]
MARETLQIEMQIDGCSQRMRKIEEALEELRAFRWELSQSHENFHRWVAQTDASALHASELAGVRMGARYAQRVHDALHDELMPGIGHGFEGIACEVDGAERRLSDELERLHAQRMDLMHALDAQAQGRPR